MIYNIAIIFDEKTNKQIHNFYNSFKDNLNIEFGLEGSSLPHATIVKFESLSELTKEELNVLLEGIKKDLIVDFSGISFLPSRSSQGCWIEISILKTQQLIDIQNKLIKRLDKYEIKSGIGDRFRPHTTFCKAKDCKFKVDNLDSQLLRKKQVSSRLVIGKADNDFEYYEL